MCEQADWWSICGEMKRLPILPSEFKIAKTAQVALRQIVVHSWNVHGCAKRVGGRADFLSSYGRWRDVDGSLLRRGNCQLTALAFRLKMLKCDLLGYVNRARQHRNVQRLDFRG